MTDKEKIKVEIERLKESGCASHIVICDTLLAFIDSLQEEPVSYDLVKFADCTSIDYRNQREKCGLKDPITLDEVEEANYNGIMAGAKWQKDQLLKDALECPLVEHPDGYVFFDLRMSYPKDKYKAGNKVKVIVIKQEEE